MDEVKRLQSLSDKFYKIHKINMNYNFIDIYTGKQKLPDNMSAIPYCVAKFFDIGNDEDDAGIINANTKNKGLICYRVREKFSEIYGDEYNSITKTTDPNLLLNTCCKNCYSFCIKKYFTEGGKIKLKTRKKS